MAVFRILFGAVIFWEFGRLIWSDLGYYKYINTVFQFKYLGFEWVQQAPDAVMYFIFGLGTLLSFLFIIGLWFRVVSILLFLSYTYIFLLDVSYWNNHYYLYVLFLGLFCFTQAHQQLSVDRYIFRFSRKKIHNWQYFVFQFQIGVVYFYGAISKIQNPDWFSGISTRNILNSSFEKNGFEISENTFEFLVQLLAHGGFWYDLLIVPMLWYRRTFWVGVGLSICFHLPNHMILNIGSFPWAMIGSLVLFYPLSKYENSSVITKGKKQLTIALVSVFVTFQMLFPLRHMFIEGSVFWTSEGKVGGWHMMSGSTVVVVERFYLVEKDDNGKILSSNEVEVSNYLNEKQIRTLGKWPYLVPQFCVFLQREAEIAGFRNIEIYAKAVVSRNGKAFKHILDPDVNMCEQIPSAWKHNQYVLLYVDLE